MMFLSQYYHHLPSRKVFRSITEVVNFFIYEVYPDKPQKSATKLNPGENQFPVSFFIFLLLFFVLINLIFMFESDFENEYNLFGLG